jgi:hypothetical protein
MLEDMLDGNEDAAGESVSRQVAIDQDKIQQALSSDRNFSVSCELGVREPVLKAMLILCCTARTCIFALL